MEDPAACGTDKLRAGSGFLVDVCQVVLRRDPTGTQREFNKIPGDVSGDDLPQLADVPVVLAFGVAFLRQLQLLADVSGQIAIGRLHLSRLRVREAQPVLNDAIADFILSHAQMLGYALRRDFSQLLDGGQHAIAHRLDLRLPLLAHDALAEDVGQPVQDGRPPIAVHGEAVLLQRVHHGVVHILLEPRKLIVPVEVAIFLGEGLETGAELPLELVQPLVAVMLKLVGHQPRDGLLDGIVVLQHLRPRMAPHLAAGHGRQPAILHQSHVAFLVERERALPHALCGRLADSHRRRLRSRLRATAALAEAGDKVLQPLLGVNALRRAQGGAGRPELVSVLEAELHHPCHMVGVANEVGIVDQPETLALILRLPLGADGGHLDGVRRLHPVHALADHQYVRGDLRAHEGAAVQAERADDVGVALPRQPAKQLHGVVQRPLGGDEDAYAALAQLADVLRDAEVVDAGEGARQIDVAGAVVHAQVRHEGDVGDGQVNRVVRDGHGLEAGCAHRGVRIQLLQHLRGHGLNLDRLYLAGLADGLRHSGQDVAYAGGALEDGAATEAEVAGDAPEGVHHRRGCVVGRLR